MSSSCASVPFIQQLEVGSTFSEGQIMNDDMTTAWTKYSVRRGWRWDWTRMARRSSTEHMPGPGRVVSRRHFVCQMCAWPERFVEGILSDSGRKETANFLTTYRLSGRHCFRTLSAHRARPDLWQLGVKGPTSADAGSVYRL